jgi:ferredoxin
MHVYVDQLQCTGSSVCEMHLPQVFSLDDQGLATVRGADGELLPDGGLAVGGASVRPGLEAGVRDAVSACPGGCIVAVED